MGGHAPPRLKLTAMRRAPLLAILVVGLGLVAAPAVFQMFTRAPGGGRMMADFRPLMTPERLDGFDDHLTTIDRGQADASRALDDLAGAEGVPREEIESRFPETARFEERWPALRDDMRGMLRDIRASLGNFEAVDALPPFALFPWFFVIPGLLLALAVGNAFRRKRLTVLNWGFVMLLGLGLVAAPVLFQMFSRAPAGAEMIDDFRELMTVERVTEVQRYFITIAGAEGELRNRVRPAVEDTDRSFEDDYPQAARFARRWPGISADMAPMVGAMSDNLDEFDGIAALPPFWLFPWFFVIPGVLVLGFGFVAGRPKKRKAPRSVIRPDAGR